MSPEVRMTTPTRPDAADPANIPGGTYPDGIRPEHAMLHEGQAYQQAQLTGEPVITGVGKYPESATPAAAANRPDLQPHEIEKATDDLEWLISGADLLLGRAVAGPLREAQNNLARVVDRLREEISACSRRSAEAKTMAKLRELQYLQACGTVARMHEAATGRIGAPIRGVVEDVADLSASVAELEAQTRGERRMAQLIADAYQARVLELERLVKRAARRKLTAGEANVGMAEAAAHTDALDDTLNAVSDSYPMPGRHDPLEDAGTDGGTP